jgi:IMP dehydrogenase
MKECLTYDDVGIKPLLSDIKHREDCNTITRVTKNVYLDIPIVSSPMDTVTDYKMCLEMDRLGGMGFLHRFKSSHKIAKTIRWFRNEKPDGTIGASIGVTGDYLKQAQLYVYSGAQIILIDVAHGHHILVKEAMEKIKNEVKGQFDLLVGNIATKEAAKDLCEWGADGLRIGIGGGCFTPGMEVLTDNGLKRIIDIELNDMVYTHTGELKPVINKLEFDRDEEIIEINDIECTKNHEFYVIHKKYKDVVDDDNLDKYAEWVEADNLTDDYFLVEIS